MAWVYMLRGTTGRHYLGATRDLDARLEQHQRGSVQTTKRLGLPVELVASMPCATLQKAMETERMLKSWKNPSKAMKFLSEG